MIPLFDAHCDTASKALETGQRIRRNSLHTDLTRGGAFSPYAQIFAVWSDGGTPGVTARFSAIFDFLLAELEANRDIITLCLSAEDVREAMQSNKNAALISVEGAEQIDCSIERLRDCYERGVRLVNPCWNYDNALCGAAMDKQTGLTAMGRDFVSAAQEMGVAVDVSHMSEAAFWGLCEISRKPLIASHSDSKALRDVPRNLTDAQFCAIAKGGGAVGLNLLPDFLAQNGDAHLYSVLAHAEHFLSLCGEAARTVCLGGDLDGTDDLPRGFSGIEDYAALYELMLREGYGEDLVRDIFYNNLLGYLERAL